MALRSVLPASAIFLSLLGACTLPTNVALKDADGLRAAETTCLRTNVARLNSSVADPGKLAQDAAASCRDQTEKLASYAVPHVSPQERQAFEQDAVRRADVAVAQARNTAAR